MKREQKTEHTKAAIAIMDERRAVMQAYVDGHPIELRSKNSEVWDLFYGVPELLWVWDEFDYRVKPSPEFRQYNKDELPGIVGRVVRNKLSGFTCIIGNTWTDIGGTSLINLHGHGLPIGCYELLTECEYLDGTPCGVQI